MSANQKLAAKIKFRVLTGNEHLSTGSLFNERRGVSVNGSVFSSVNGTSLVDRLSNNVDDSAEGLGADGHHDGVAGVIDFLATDESFCGVQGNRAHVVATQMLGDLQNQAVGSSSDFERVQNWW